MLALLKKTETIFKICLLILFLFLMWVSRTYPRNSRLFPEILGGITVVLILISFAQDFLKVRRGQEKEVAKEPPPEAPPSDIVEEKMRWMKEVEEKAEDAGYEVLETGLRRKRLVESILIILISLGIGYLGGFLLTVPFYFIAFGILHGEKKKAVKYIVIALVITAVTYLSFTKLMGIPLLQGLWWELD
ncbi:MAG: tripartite tricarboxylate transporter TctB family protein [Thermodesulfobacteriota bacterium]